MLVFLFLVFRRFIKGSNLLYKIKREQYVFNSIFLLIVNHSLSNLRCDWLTYESSCLPLKSLNCCHHTQTCIIVYLFQTFLIQKHMLLAQIKNLFFFQYIYYLLYVTKCIGCPMLKKKCANFESFSYLKVLIITNGPLVPSNVQNLSLIKLKSGIFIFQFKSRIFCL